MAEEMEELELGYSSWERTCGRSIRGRRLYNSDNDSSNADEEAIRFNVAASLKSEKMTVAYFRDIIGQFNEHKRRLVVEIGFGAFLQLPEVKQVDRKFSMWLFSKVRWWNGYIKTREKFNLPVTSSDIERIIALPSSGRDVIGSELKEIEENAGFITKVFGIHTAGNECNDLVEKIIQEELPEGASKLKTHKFKIAFALFTMNRFLMPNKKNMNGSPDIWGAISEPDQLKTYNWSSYFLYHLMEVARLAIWDEIDKREIITLPFCEYLLQIFYLDNLDLGPQSLSHDVLPRVIAFDSYTLDAMIRSEL